MWRMGPPKKVPEPLSLGARVANRCTRAMREEKRTADRLTVFSDAVFAVIVTIMVLELKAPDQPAFSSLWPLWPTAMSYAVSYLFIAIIWINHHYLMRFVGPPTLALIWTNFIICSWCRSYPLQPRGLRAPGSHRPL